MIEMTILVFAMYSGKERKEMFYLTTHSTHFIYAYMASEAMYSRPFSFVFPSSGFVLSCDAMHPPPHGAALLRSRPQHAHVFPRNPCTVAACRHDDVRTAAAADDADEVPLPPLSADAAEVRTEDSNGRQRRQSQTEAADVSG